MTRLTDLVSSTSLVRGPAVLEVHQWLPRLAGGFKFASARAGRSKVDEFILHENRTPVNDIL